MRLDSELPADAPPASRGADSGEWTRLRALLLGSERAHLDRLEGKLGDRANLTRSVADVLPGAVSLRGAEDPELARALAPLIERALHRSVRVQPGPIVEALYPIIAPAIRRSISEALAQLIQSFNEALARSLSLRALKWRFDAWRTGQPYAHAVLLATLVYRVEQVFLIHRDTGLLLHHVIADRVVSQDPDMVAGMLTAIRSFAADSFKLADEDGINVIRLGDLALQVRVGPRAILAAVVRGNPPERLQTRLSEVLEQIHATHAAALAEFQGDTGRFADLGGMLSGCLSEQMHSSEPQSPWRLRALLAVVAAALAAVVWHHHRTAADWQELLADLAQEPGLVVIDGGEAGRHAVRGLRDPLARDPRQVAGADRQRRLDVQWNFQPFLSMDPRMVLLRARANLKPPPGVTLSLDGDVLRAAGTASAQWVHAAAIRASYLPGIRLFDAAGVVATHEAELEKVRQALGGLAIHFPFGSAVLPPAELRRIDTLVPDLSRFGELAAAAGSIYLVEVIGRADAPGTTAANLKLSQDRANAVRELLIGHGLDPDRVHALGIGAPGAPAAAGGPQVPDEMDRRVDLRITLSPDAVPGRERP